MLTPPYATLLRLRRQPYTEPLRHTLPLPSRRLRACCYHLIVRLLRAMPRASAHAVMFYGYGVLPRYVAARWFLRQRARYMCLLLRAHAQRAPGRR